MGKRSFEKQLLCLRICWEGDGWHCSYDFKNCRKRRGVIARQHEGRRGWESQSGRAYERGGECSLYAACKTSLQILCLCELTAEAMCMQSVCECMCCLFQIVGLCELLTARNGNVLLKGFCSQSACLWLCGMCD